jgi:cytochrome P450
MRMGRPDLAEPLVKGTTDPYSVYSTLREQAPVYWSEGFGAWLVTSYECVRDVYRSHEVFSNRARNASKLQALPAEVRAHLEIVEIVENTQALASADPPVLSRQRRVLNRPLAPRQLAAKRATIEELCEELADSMAAHDQPDLIRDFSTQLSYRSILGFFGAPMDLVDVLGEASAARIEFVLRTADQPGLADAAERYDKAMVKLRDAFESLYPRLQSELPDSIIHMLLNPISRNDILERNEMFLMLRNFMAAGHENIIFTVAQTIYQLLANPEQMEIVRGDQARAADAFEEAVRFETPHQSNLRVAASDVVLAGQQIRAGDRVLNVKASANRDPAAWTDPDRYDVTRDQSEPDGGSVAFGQGAHFCLGSGVARLEGPIAASVLLRRFPNIRLRDGWQPTWRPGPLQRKLVDFPVLLH